MIHYENSSQLAKCFITKLNSNIDIPNEILETLQPMGHNIVAVVPGESKKFSFFLTDANQVLFMRLFLDKESLDDSFFTSLRNKLKELEINNLFSTGVCFKNEICVWEGVFEFDDDSNYNAIKTGLAEVTHVQDTYFETIRVSE
jgi:hypothetical protein